MPLSLTSDAGKLLTPQKTTKISGISVSYNSYLQSVLIRCLVCNASYSPFSKIIRVFFKLNKLQKKKGQQWIGLLLFYTTSSMTLASVETARQRRALLSSSDLIVSVHWRLIN